MVFAPFMPFIISVLKPFDNLAHEKQNKTAKKKVKKSLLPASLSSSTISTSSTKANLSFFQESILKYQTELINIDTLLNLNLSVLPFKSYFEVLYKFSEIFNRLDFLIQEFDDLDNSSVHQYLLLIMAQTGQLNSIVLPAKEMLVGQQAYGRRSSFPQQRTQANSVVTVGEEETQSKWSKEDTLTSNDLRTGTIRSRHFDSESQTNDNLNKPIDCSTSNKHTESINVNDEFEKCSYSSGGDLTDQQQRRPEQIKIEMIYEQKFYLSLFYIPNLMFNMSNPKKNQLAQSICTTTNETFELILPYLISLFEDPNTCVNSFLFLFNKLAKFLSKNELSKRFLPQILHVLNVVDLNETIGIDLNNKDDEKMNFCKLFDFPFINELRITFGLQDFLTQIFPFLIEAISGFKDFEYETDSVSSFTTPSNQSARSELTSHELLNKLTESPTPKESTDQNARKKAG